MKISEVMTPHVDTCRTDDKLQDCARTMKQENVGSLVVVDERNNPVGIITDRDIVIRAVADAVNPAEGQASEFMTESPVSIMPDAELEEAANIMAQHQVRRLPVLSGEKLVGLVSMGDLAVRAERVAAHTLHDVSIPLHGK